jgi:soluble lytic murein transglycosylase-like protein
MNELIFSSLFAISALSTWGSAANLPAATLFEARSAVDNASAQWSDANLNAVRQADLAARKPDGTFLDLTAAEHLRRGNIYLSNRLFDNAREHFLLIINRLPTDSAVPTALFGMGRSYFLAGRYQEAAPYFERVYQEYSETREGRDGLSQWAASLLRAGNADQAAARYIEYTQKYPTGERFESSFLNVIDAYREAGQPAEALKWISIVRGKFKGTATEVNAVFARLRFDVASKDWQHAIATADGIRGLRFDRGVQTSPDEVLYLKAYSLEHAGRIPDAVSAYLGILDNGRSFYGMLATIRLRKIAPASLQSTVGSRESYARAQTLITGSQYPALYRQSIVNAAGGDVDPRLVLSIMRQESNFRPAIKSPAAARGLLQLTIDTAYRYAASAGINNLKEADLYRPDISIQVGTQALRDLGNKFPSAPEAVAAAYNGGDDNVARWVKRAQNTDPGVFAAEVGFAETKDYVFKVMANYRAYQELYTRDLRPKQ